MCDFFEHPRQFKVGKSPWGGENDEIGRLNLITPESREKILNASDFTHVFDLSVNYFMGMPSWTAAGDPPYQIWMTHTPSGNIVDNPMNLSREANELIGYSGDAFSMYTHTGTHIDALCHYAYHGEIWNGFTEKDHLGSRHWEVCGPEKFPPIIARGVLIDVAGYKGVDMLPDSYGIGKKDIKETLEKQSVEVEPGDVVMIRTGRMNVWPDQDKYLTNSPGINVEAAEYLVEKGAMVIGADNVALEQMPSPELPDAWVPVHAYLLIVGIPIIEVMWLEELAKEKIYEVGFVGNTMPLKGATGAHLRPIAFPLKK